MPKRRAAPKRQRRFSDYDSGQESDSESQGESGQGLAQSPMQSDEEPGTPTHVAYRAKRSQEDREKDEIAKWEAKVMTRKVKNERHVSMGEFPSCSPGSC